MFKQASCFSFCGWRTLQMPPKWRLYLPIQGQRFVRSCVASRHIEITHTSLSVNKQISLPVSQIVYLIWLNYTFVVFFVFREANMCKTLYTHKYIKALLLLGWLFREVPELPTAFSTKSTSWWFRSTLFALDGDANENRRDVEISERQDEKPFTVFN